MEILSATTRRLSMPSREESAAINYRSQHHHELLDSVESVQNQTLLDWDGDSVEIKFHSNYPFGGIFDYLWMKNQENPIQSNVVTVTGNSFSQNYQNVMKHLIERDWKGYWCSSNEVNSYITFDFHDHYVNLTHYTLKSYNLPKGFRHLKSWVIEGNNHGDWKEIHKVKRSNHLNGSNSIASFPVKNAGFYQQIRIRLANHNCYGDNHLFLTGVEFFGFYR